jgi:hypothetical protein
MYGVVIFTHQCSIGLSSICGTHLNLTIKWDKIVGSKSICNFGVHCTNQRCGNIFLTYLQLEDNKLVDH